MKTRVDSDESYVVNLYGRVLKQKAKRQYTFNFLRGDPGKRFSTGKSLPVDAYYEEINLVELDYRCFQHDRRKRVTRDEAKDEAVIRQELSSFTTPS